MDRISVVIPTYNREQELLQCIRSILVQDDLPEEIVVVDDGRLETQGLEDECRRKGVSFLYHRKSEPGLTASRNRGVEMSGGDLILFFDDDVILKEGYIRSVREAYARDRAGSLGGVGGVIDNFPPLSRRGKVLRAYQRLFMITGRREGTVLPSGFCVHYGDTGDSAGEKRGVDFLPGCAMSFRRKVFGEFRFDTAGYPGFGIGEDVDFSYRVSRKYPLVVEPAARLDHLVVQKMRPERYQEGYLFYKTFYLNFVRLFRKNRWQWLFFWYALTGYTIQRTVTALLSGDLGRLSYVGGFLRGVFDSLTGTVGGPGDGGGGRS